MEKSMAILSGLSGAVVRRDCEGVYVKYSNDPSKWDFLNEQAVYMADCGLPFVEILGMAHGRYWMQEYGICVVSNHEEAIREAKRSLEQLWEGEPRFVDRNWMNAHRTRLGQLCEMNRIDISLSTRLFEKFEKNVVENERYLTVCRATHGDATLSNTVYESNGTIRWVDPIPPSLWLPAFKAVDLGKLLQSSHGWEYAMNNFRAPQPCDGEVLEGEKVIDMMAASYFHTLCYLRILRYAEVGSLPHDYALNKLYELLR